MNKIVDRFLTKLFNLAEKVTTKFDDSPKDPVTKCEAPHDPPRTTIRFTKEHQIVEGDLF